MSNNDKDKMVSIISTRMIEYIDHYVDVVKKVECDYSAYGLEKKAACKSELKGFIHSQIYALVNSGMYKNSSNDLLVKELCKYIINN